MDLVLQNLGLKSTYERLILAIREGLGDSTEQFPNPQGYSFYLPEITESGSRVIRAYVALYAPEGGKGLFQYYLQPRAIEAVGKETLEKCAIEMGSNFALKPSGVAEIWLDGRKDPTVYVTHLKALGQAIATGWRQKKEKPSTSAELQ